MMEKRTFNFSKGLGIFFAVAAGIGTAVLGYVDRTDWIQVAFYSIAVTSLVLWGWHHFSIKWSFTSNDEKDNLESNDQKLTNLYIYDYFLKLVYCSHEFVYRQTQDFQYIRMYCKAEI